MVLRFFRAEIEEERAKGWTRLSRVPDTNVGIRLEFFNGLSPLEQDSCLDFLALMASSMCVPDLRASIDYRAHPIAQAWSNPAVAHSVRHMSVPLLRACVGQFKMDQKRGVRSRVSRDLFDYASTLKSPKATDLRKSVKNTLQNRGLKGVSRCGGGEWRYNSSVGSHQIEVEVDYGGIGSQLRYTIRVANHQFVPGCLEQALGFGLGWWNRITVENQVESMLLFSELIDAYTDLMLRLDQVLESDGN